MVVTATQDRLLWRDARMRIPKEDEAIGPPEQMARSAHQCLRARNEPLTLQRPLREGLPERESSQTPTGGPWSHSTRLLACCSARCHAAGSSSSSTTGYVAARSVITSTGAAFVAMVRSKNRRAAVMSRRGRRTRHDLAELTDRTVHVPPSPSDPHIGLVHEPASSYSVPAGAGGLGQQRCECWTHR